MSKATIIFALVLAIASQFHSTAKAKEAVACLKKVKEAKDGRKTFSSIRLRVDPPSCPKGEKAIPFASAAAGPQIIGGGSGEEVLPIQSFFRFIPMFQGFAANDPGAARSDTPIAGALTDFIARTHKPQNISGGTYEFKLRKNANVPTDVGCEIDNSVANNNQCSDL